jgi:hypothetical protein
MLGPFIPAFDAPGYEIELGPLVEIFRFCGGKFLFSFVPLPALLVPRQPRGYEE